MQGRRGLSAAVMHLLWGPIVGPDAAETEEASDQHPVVAILSLYLAVRRHIASIAAAAVAARTTAAVAAPTAAADDDVSFACCSERRTVVSGGSCCWLCCC